MERVDESVSDENNRAAGKCRPRDGSGARNRLRQRDRQREARKTDRQTDRQTERKREREKRSIADRKGVRMAESAQRGWKRMDPAC